MGVWDRCLDQIFSASLLPVAALLFRFLNCWRTVLGLSNGACYEKQQSLSFPLRILTVSPHRRWEMESYCLFSNSPVFSLLWSTPFRWRFGGWYLTIPPHLWIHLSCLDGISMKRAHGTSASRRAGFPLELGNLSRRCNFWKVCCLMLLLLKNPYGGIYKKIIIINNLRRA